MSAIPNVTSRIVLDTKYGKIIKARPETNGTTVFCLLPYTKKPSPIEPKSKPQRRDDVSNKAPNDEVERRAASPARGEGTLPYAASNARRSVSEGT
jgi:hypothetical protein